MRTDDSRKDSFTIHVVLASSLTVLREGMKRILHPQYDIRVMAEVSHASEILSNENLLMADVLVVIAHPTNMGGTDCLERLRKANPSLKLIIIARSPSLHQILNMLRGGVRGLLDAGCAANQLPAAIRAVSSGRLYMHEEVGRLVAADLGEVSKDFTHRSLTQREFEIFEHLAVGDKVSEIATRLGISIKTVSTHKSRLMEKMGIRSHSQLIQYAVANGLFNGLADRRIDKDPQSLRALDRSD